jgi:DNA replication protein DnaC
LLTDETIQKMLDLKLAIMARSFREMSEKPPTHDLTFEERIGMLIDHEWTERENRRLDRRLRDAKLGVRACLDEVVCDPARGIEKSMMKQLATGAWIRAFQNVILVGATGVGKSFVASALADAACRKGLRALFVRVPRLLEELSLARAAGVYGSTLTKIAKIDVLILDDFLLTPMKETERRDLLEVLEDRYGKSSTVMTSQLPTKNWYEALTDPTIAEAICDRIVHNAHVITLKGPSMRRSKGLANASMKP